MDPSSLSSQSKEEEKLVETFPRFSASLSEFEFCVDNNVPTTLVSADELFADGFLLPLHQTTATPSTPKPYSSSSSSASALPPTAFSGKSSLKEIFKSIERDQAHRRRERNNNSSSTSSAELNINLWPFSRSRSGRTGTTGVKLPTGTLRRAHSAPCSRREEKSSSHSEKSSTATEFLSKKNKTGGIRLTRAGPVWQIRRFAKNAEKKGPCNAVSEVREKIDGDDSSTGDDNVIQSCIGYRNYSVRCSARHEKQQDDVDDHRDTAVGATTTSVLFNLRSLLSKKVH